MKVLYDKKTDTIFCLPVYMVAQTGRWVSTSTAFAIWRTRPELVILGDL